MRLTARLNFCAFLCLLLFFPVCARLTYLQVFSHKRLDTLTAKGVQRTIVREPPRGRILDRNRNVLSESQPSWSCYLQPPQFHRSAAVLARLSAVLEIPPEKLRDKAAGGRKFVWLKKGINWSQAEQIRKLEAEGVGLIHDQIRHYPNGRLSRPLLGAVDAHGAGLAGLERIYDARLGGEAEQLEILKDGIGGTIFKKVDRESGRIQHLVLTLDRNMQFLAEEALESEVIRQKAKSGMVLAQDPNTGEILAMASYPQKLFHVPGIQDVIEPGSTFKIVAVLAALEEKTLAAQERIDCGYGRWELAKRLVVHDHEPYGSLNLGEILAYSSNIGIAKVAERVGRNKFYGTARALGFGNRTGIDYPGESSGLLRPPGTWSRTTFLIASFGQGIGATPLQMLAAFSAVANGGKLLKPRLVRGFASDEAGQAGELAAAPPPEVVRQVASPQALAELKKMLLGVIETGTGANAKVPGYKIAGKTATAQKFDHETGRYSKTRVSASFCGFFPYARPEVTLFVLVDEPQLGHYGSEAAAPLFSRLAKKYLALKGIPPDQNQLAKNRDKVIE
ncbi:MAG: penicillin-binding protein 2 [Elusimicrobia bacterium]|nr:penicillin-binding protein 2 [Elusimicrobiota bacterium]